ncbi:MAG: radical SAM protein [Candidatus Xenobiia bacterium LiM19]
MKIPYDSREQHNLAAFWLDRGDKSSVYGAVPADSISESHVERIIHNAVLSPFTHYWRSEGRFFLYHSVTQKKLCGSLSLFDIVHFLSLHPDKRGRLPVDAIREARPAEVLPLLKCFGFLIDTEVDPYESLALLQNRISLREERFSILFLFLSHRCNLRCEYCLKSSGAGALPVQRSMDRSTALQALSLFRRLRRGGSGTATIVLYGGEPLLNSEVLRLAVSEVRGQRHLYDSRDGAAEIELFTNGTLIDSETVDLIRKYELYPVISIDGKEVPHNRYRQGPRGGGSFRAAVRGCRALRKKGIIPAISCTVGAHNIDDLEESVSFFINELEAREIRFYPIKCLPGGNSLEISSERFIECIRKIYPLLRKNSVMDNVCYPLLNRLSLERISFKSCSAYGGQLSVMPDGSAGPCINMAEEYRCLWGNVHESSIEQSIARHGSRELFLKRSPFFRKECRNCVAISLCGGGCIHEGFVKHGDYLGVDAVHCAVMKSLLPWGIERLFEEMPRTLRQESC